MPTLNHIGFVAELDRSLWLAGAAWPSLVGRGLPQFKQRWPACKKKMTSKLSKFGMPILKRGSFLLCSSSVHTHLKTFASQISKPCLCTKATPPKSCENPKPLYHGSSNAPLSTVCTKCQGRFCSRLKPVDCVATFRNRVVPPPGGNIHQVTLHMARAYCAAL
jgi:hypothetical protein